MWLSDPADLQDRLLQTIYYFHAFPPGMDLFTGILLKVAGAHAALLAQITFWLLGLVLITSIFYLARACGLSARVSFIVAIAFSLLPQSIYFEHLYLYEEPIAALLCLSVALFHAALTRQSVRLWLGFFTLCAVIGVTRSTFHLLWLAVMLCLGLWFSTPRDRRRVLAAACAPAALVVALYVKNLIVFGTFSAFTYGPSSYAHVTVSHLHPRDEGAVGSRPPTVTVRGAEPVRRTARVFAGVFRHTSHQLAVAAHGSGSSNGARAELQSLGHPGSQSRAQRGRVVLHAHATARVRDHCTARIGGFLHGVNRMASLHRDGALSALPASPGARSVRVDRQSPRPRLPRRARRVVCVPAARDDLDRPFGRGDSCDRATRQRRLRERCSGSAC